MTNHRCPVPRVAAACLGFVLVGGCSDSAVHELPSEEVAAYKLEAPPTLCPNDPPAFYVVTGAENIAAFDGRIGYVRGTVALGDAKINVPWSWHYVPNSMEWGLILISPPTGCPSDIERAARQGVLGDPIVPWKITRQR